jgi:hypothetical protein
MHARYDSIARGAQWGEENERREPMTASRIGLT